MSSRAEEKAERRRDRIEHERVLVAAGARRRRLTFGAAMLTGTAAVVVAVLVFGGRGLDQNAVAAGPFGQHYPGLDARRSAVRVPTMMDTMSSSVHFHPQLSVEIDGKPLPIPANIGIDPSKDGMQMAGLHTHDTTGKVHVEGVSGATLAQLFAVWGVPFSATRFGPYRDVEVRVLVNGKPSRRYGDLRLADGQQIEVAVTRTRRPDPRPQAR